MTVSVSQQPPLELYQPQSTSASSQQQLEKRQKQQESQGLAVEPISASSQQQSEPSNCLVTVKLLTDISI